MQHDKISLHRTFAVIRDIKNFDQGVKLLPGVIVSQTGPVSFVMERLAGGLQRRHQGQLRKRLSVDPKSHQCPFAFSAPLVLEASLPTTKTTADRETPLQQSELSTQEPREAAGSDAVPSAEQAVPEIPEEQPSNSISF